jgi:putative membrane protein
MEMSAGVSIFLSILAITGSKRETLMIILSNLFVGLVAIFHLYFLTLEMFLWTKPSGRRAFGLTPEFAQASKNLAANQGLYNGFLAAGLFWGLFAGADGFAVKVFFHGCVVVAGLFGGLTASRKILWVQALPGIVALVFVFLSK